MMDFVYVEYIKVFQLIRVFREVTRYSAFLSFLRNSRFHAAVSLHAEKSDYLLVSRYLSSTEMALRG